MAFKYKKKKITLYFDKQNKVEKYVAANVLVGSINYKKLCDEVNQRTGVHRSMVDVVLKGVQDVMIAYLEEGFSVKLDEFGAFRPAINAEGKDKEEDGAARIMTMEELDDPENWTEYVYIFNRDGEWKYFESSPLFFIVCRAI